MCNWNEMYFFQVGLIILYDHVHPIGAFAKNSTIDVSLLFKSTSNNFYYTFKIFLRFWLAKIPLIHHNKLLSTKFGRILRFVKNDVNCAAKLPDYWTAYREDLRPRLRCFGSEYKKAEHLTRFTKKKWANYWLKIYQEQQEDNLTDAICYLENICSAEQPFIS